MHAEENIKGLVLGVQHFDGLVRLDGQRVVRNYADRHTVKGGGSCLTVRDGLADDHQITGDCNFLLCCDQRGEFR